MNIGYRIKSPFEQKGRLFLRLGIEFATRNDIIKVLEKWQLEFAFSRAAVSGRTF